MYRTEDIYNWKRLEQWKYVIDEGVVEWYVTNEMPLDDSVFENAVNLLIHDCFPMAIVCCRTKRGGKKIFATPLWNNIFSFVDNQRQMKKDGQYIYFREMEAEEKSAILRAQIFSMWFKEDENNTMIRN